MSKPKILFVYVNPLRIPYLDLGIASLSAYLKERGYETKLIDFTFNLKIRKAISILKKYQPDIVCFNSRSGEFNHIVKIAGILRENHNSLYLCGGIHPTICPEEVIRERCFDGICIGEGELALYSLVQKIEKNEEYKDALGFWFKEGEKILKNNLPKLISDLDKLPIIDYSLFEMDTYLKIRCGQLDYVSARGCPFFCTYCVNHNLMKTYSGLGVYSRRKSPQKIISELKQLIENYQKIKKLKFADEHFIIDKKRLGELAELYIEKVKLPFECDVRADFCDEETIKLLKRMGCDKLNIAIETGDEELRNNLLKKKITDQQIINAFWLAKKYNLHTMAFNMVGFPFETKEQIWKTIKLNKVVRPDSIQVSIFTPFKGTDLYNFCQRENLLLTDKLESSYYFGNYFKNPYLSSKELNKIYKKFTFYCYKDRSKLKAYILLMRDFSIPYYLKFGKYIPNFAKKIIYFLFWNLKVLKFVSK